MPGSDDLLSQLRWGLVGVAARRDLRARLFPADAACGCGVTNRALLILGRSPAICYECDRCRRYGNRCERHHIGGANSWLVVPLRANRHRLHDLAYQDVLERLPLSFAERLWIELQVFVAFKRLLDQAEGAR
jgi:hypothetical protein